MIPRLHLRDFARREEAYHFARVTLPETPTQYVHRHDFHEIFWVEEGFGLHVINGCRRDLRVGMCLCIRPNDAHSVLAGPGHSLRLINIAFPSPTWQTLRRRYFRDRPDFFAGPVARREFDLTHLLSTVLFTAAEDLGHGRRSRLKIERFIINLFYEFVARTPPNESPRLPHWFERACIEIRKNRAFAGGVPAFARLAKRSPEHLAREARRLLHKTPTDILNEARLAHAASELTSSSRSITDIAADCGLENLSHFYHLFKRHFRDTPRRYRLRQRSIVR